ncbi:hypothetical protein SB776_41475, partial [Burkholderia sp. SIMBA_045]
DALCIGVVLRVTPSDLPTNQSMWAACDRADTAAPGFAPIINSSDSIKFRPTRLLTRGTRL